MDLNLGYVIKYSLFALSGGGLLCPPSHLKALASLNLFAALHYAARHSLAPPLRDNTGSSKDRWEKEYPVLLVGIKRLFPVKSTG
jgi:hypothetical protein